LKYDVAENIAMSTKTPVNPVEVWRNSAGHRKNMLNSSFKYVGVAVATNGREWYYVMRLK
jgi:uncharacterized protein YkwD